jgi:hypothetical protein
MNKKYQKETFELQKKNKKRPTIEEEFASYNEICLGGLCMPKYAVEAEIDAMPRSQKNVLIEMLQKQKDINLD